MITILELATAAFASIAAVFFLLEKYQASESAAVRSALASFWERIGLDQWLDMPERAIRWFLSLASVRYEDLTSALALTGFRWWTGPLALCMAPGVIHITRFPAFFAAILPFIILTGGLSFLASCAVLRRARFTTQELPRWKERLGLCLEVFVGLALVSMLISLGVKHFNVDLFVRTTAVKWIWIAFLTVSLMAGLLFVAGKAFRFFRVKRVGDLLDDTTTVASFLVIVLSWALFGSGFIDIVRWYTASVSVIGRWAAAGSMVRVIPGFFLLFSGAHLLALSLFNFVPPASALAENIYRINKRITSRVVERWFSLFVLSAAFTAGAMGLGSYMVPQSEAQLSVQLLLVNFVCDVIAVISCILLFRKVVSKGRVLSRLPLVVLAVFGIAGIAAVLSLLLGLAGSNAGLSLSQVMQIFIGRDPWNSSVFRLDGYFFVMHTTFIPLAFYASLLLLAWWSKAVLSMSRFLLVPKQHVSRPYALARASFLLLAAGTALWRLILAVISKLR